MTRRSTIGDRRVRGATTVEMTLVGIPIIFILISVFEMSRGMWQYHTLAYALKEGVRYSTVHGANCVTKEPFNNSCTVTVSQVAQVIQNAGIGLDLSATVLTFISGGNTDATCSLNGTASDNPPGCQQGAFAALTWPVVNNPTSLVQIKAKMAFPSALAMFWPGAGSMSFAVAYFNADSADRIQY
jgi:Flp pilus assembly protein TadG